MLNSSSFPPPLPHSSSNSSLSPFEFCLRDRSSNPIFASYLVFGLLVVLPVFILVLYVGCRLWRKKRTLSHSDFLTYHMVSIEIIGLVGCILYCCGTCMDRFLAVVYPVAYMSLKQGGGVRIRNVCTVCAWVCCLSGMSVIEEVILKSTSIFAFCFWLVSLVFISFFSLSVLCVLIRPGPGDRKRADQSKQRAFNSITIILCVLMLRCLAFLTACAIFTLSELQLKVRCAVIMSVIWCAVPSSLVLPLMFLHRAGKLWCCKVRLESG